MGLYRTVILMICIFQTANFLLWKFKEWVQLHYDNYFGKIKYIVYKMILKKDKEYYDTYDLGKLNSYAGSGDVIQRMFSHKFLELFRMFSFFFQFVAIAAGLSFNLALPLFLPVLLRLLIEQYAKKVGHIRWWRNKKLK